MGISTRPPGRVFSCPKKIKKIYKNNTRRGLAGELLFVSFRFPVVAASIVCDRQAAFYSAAEERVFFLVKGFVTVETVVTAGVVRIHVYSSSSGFLFCGDLIGDAYTVALDVEVVQRGDRVIDRLVKALVDNVSENASGLPA